MPRRKKRSGIAKRLYAQRFANTEAAPPPPECSSLSTESDLQNACTESDLQHACTPCDLPKQSHNKAKAKP